MPSKTSSSASDDHPRSAISAVILATRRANHNNIVYLYIIRGIRTGARSKSDPHAYNIEIACLFIIIVVMALYTTTTAYQMQIPYQIPHVAEPVAIVLADQAPLNAEGDQCNCGVPPNASNHVKAVSLSSSRRFNTINTTQHY